MNKRTSFIVIATVLLLLAVISVMIFCRKKTEEPVSQELQIVADAEPDGSITFHIPITIRNNETGNSQTQYATINSKEIPGKILVTVNEERYVVDVDIDAENGKFKYDIHPETPSEAINNALINREEL